MNRSPDGDKQLEVNRTKMTFNTVEIIDEAREEPEERLLLEVGALFFMKFCKH